MQLIYGLNPCWLRLNRILCQEMCRLLCDPDGLALLEGPASALLAL